MSDKVEEPIKTEPPGNSDQTPDQILAIYTRKLYKATLALAIGTLIIACISQEQACDSRKQVEISRASDSAHRVSDYLQLRGDSIKNWNDSLASIAQVNALLKQVVISDSNARRQLRAYVDILCFTPILNGNILVMPSVQIEDQGETPANDAIIRFNIGMGSVKSMKFTKAYTDSAIVGPVMRASMGVSRQYYIRNGLFQPEAIAAIKQYNNVGLFFWGVVIYSDIFGQKDSTEFRFESFWVQDSLTGGKLSQFQQCETGNSER